MNWEGAKAAIVAKVTAAGPALEYIELDSDHVEPPTDRDGNPVSFVYVEFLAAPGIPHSFGAPGNRLMIHDSIVMFHVQTPKGTAGAPGGTYRDAIATALIQQELPMTNGERVLLKTPMVAPGSSDTSSGNYLRQTVGMLFEYHYLF